MIYTTIAIAIIVAFGLRSIWVRMAVMEPMAEHLAMIRKILAELLRKSETAEALIQPTMVNPGAVPVIHIAPGSQRRGKKANSHFSICRRILKEIPPGGLVSFSNIAKRSGLAHAQAARAIYQLYQHGYLTHHGRGRYRIIGTTKNEKELGNGKI